MVEPFLRTYSPGSIKTSRTVHHNISEAEIGMALGSPFHPPENWQQSQQSSGIETIGTLQPMDDMSHYADSVIAPKQKKGRKWFGLFRSKKEKTPASFYQLKPQSQEEIPISDPSLPEANRTGMARGRSTSSITDKKPEMKRSQTAPPTPGLQHSFQSSTSTTIRAGTPDIRVQGPIGVEVLRSYPEMSPEGPKINLALPSVQLERYSVMFGDILPKSSTTSSSLLQRRQAALDRLKSVEEALATKEAELEARAKALSKRRATSPQPHQSSPSFSLFPSTPSRQGNREISPTREKSSLYRSNTSPARPLLAPRLDNDVHADIVFDNKPPTDRGRHKYKDISSSTSTKRPSKQSTRSSSSSPRSRPHIETARTWSPDESQLLSPSSAEGSEGNARTTDGQEKEDSHNASQLTASRSKFEEKESTWQMVNSKKQNHGAPSSVSGSMTSEASTVSSSNSTTSFSSVPGGSNANSMAEREKVRERGSRKTSPTSIQSPQKAKETKISVQSGREPRPTISTHNTTPSILRPSPSFSSRPSLQKSSSSATIISANSSRPLLQKPPMTSASLSSTDGSSPRKILLPASPHPQRSITNTIPSPQPEAELSYNTHQKQESTSSITPSLFDVEIDDTLDFEGSSRSRDPEQKRLESAAGVSIARQISVSRQQRQLLIPIKTSGSLSKRNPFDRSTSVRSSSGRSEQSPSKRVVTGQDVTGRNGSPLESVAELSLRGEVLSSVEGQSGSDIRGIGIPLGKTNGEIKVKESSKPSTPTLVVVPGADEKWGAGSASESSGLNISREKVEAMMKGSRGSPVLENSGWEEKGGKMLSVSPRTEMGSGHQHRRSERVVVVEV